MKPKPYSRDGASIGWSFSPVSNFQTCQRRCYLERIKPQWMPPPADTTSDVKILQMTRSLPILIGDSFHRSVAEHHCYRASGRDMPETDFYCRTFRLGGGEHRRATARDAEALHRFPQRVRIGRRGCTDVRGGRRDRRPRIAPDYIQASGGLGVSMLPRKSAVLASSIPKFMGVCR